MALTQQDKEEMYQYLVTRGKSLGSLDEGDSNLSNKYLAPVLEYSGGTASKAVRLAVSQLKGDSAYQDWVKQPGNEGKTLSDFILSLKGGKGDPGAAANMSIGTVASGETPSASISGEAPDYKLNLILKEGEKGDTGKTPVLASVGAQSGETPAGNFTADGTDESGNPKYMLNLTLPKGEQGRPGKDFQILGYYDTIADLRTAITSPEPGEAYGVGTAAPYPIYIWDAVSQDWVNNGAIQGPAGRSGKSARVNTDTGYWEEFDDDTQAWKQTEALGVYNIATSEKDGLMSKGDKAKLDQMKGGDIEVSKANVEKVLIGDITSHTHDRLTEVTNMPTDVWDGVTVSTALVGSGTVADPYLIKSCADYIHFYRHPNLYSYAMVGDGPTPEMLANPKQIKFISNLDFDNHSLDFGDLLVNPNKSTDEEVFSKALLLVNVDGQNCNLSNINFSNTWTVLPFGAYSAVRSLNVISGILTIAASTINDLELVTTDSSNPVVLSPWTLLAGMSIIENVSFVAEIKLTGDIELQLMFVGGPVVLRALESIITSGISGESYFHSNITFSADTGLTKTLTVAYNPAIINYDQSNPVMVVGYDCTHAITEEPTEESSGLIVGMLIDSNDCNPYTLYVNTDNASPMYESSSITPFHTAKTTAEMKSPEFLALLNGNTETFVADTENVNDGYPVFKPNKIEQVVYDGYVAKSEFDQFKKGQGAGSDNVYKLDIDLTGSISRLTSEQQTAFYGRTYVAPTSDNIVELLGGVDGIRKLYNDFTISKTKKVIIVPTQYFYYPGYSFATTVAVVCGSVNDAGEINDDTSVYLILGLIALSSFFSISIEISHFNTANQAATFSSSENIYLGSSDVLDYLTSSDKTKPLSANQGRVLKELIDKIGGSTVENSLTSSSTTAALSANQGRVLKGLVDGKVASTEITTIKKLTQSAYDALSSKDSKTLYIIA